MSKSTLLLIFCCQNSKVHTNTNNSCVVRVQPRSDDSYSFQHGLGFQNFQTCWTRFAPVLRRFHATDDEVEITVWKCEVGVGLVYPVFFGDHDDVRRGARHRIAN